VASENYGRKFFPEMNLEGVDTLDRFKLHPGKRTVYLSLIECVKSFLIPEVDSISSATMPANSLHFEHMLKQACEESVTYRGGIVIDREIEILSRFSTKDVKIWTPMYFDLFNLSKSELVDMFLPHDIIWLDFMCLFTTRYYNLLDVIIKSATGTFIVAFTVYHGRGKQHCDDPAKHIISNSGSYYNITEMASVRYQSFTGTRMSTYILGVKSK